jgi:Uma2 family endonuclease
MALRANPPNLEKTYTPEEFENMPEFNERYELIKGRLVKRPMAGDDHGRIAQHINDMIFLFDQKRVLGRLWFDTNFDVGTGWMPIPDLGYVVAERVPPRSKKSIKVVPDLVVEIQSPSDLRSKTERDAAAKKLKDWQEVGVKIIWSINPDKKIVEVYHLGQDAPVDVLTVNDILSGENIIPGFTLAVKDLFE